MAVGINRRHLASRDAQGGSIGPEKFADTLRRGRYVFETFMDEPLCSKGGSTAAPTVTDLTTNVVNTGRYQFTYKLLAEESDAASAYPLLGTDGGYDWKMGAELGDGVEITFGSEKAGHPRNFVGSGENFFGRILVNPEDASGADIVFGVKKAAATVATLTEITDIAAIRVLGNSASTDASFTILTNLNNGGTSDYDTTTPTVTGLEDATSVELEVRGVGGKAFFFVNGVEVSPAPSYTFDSGDSLAFFVRLVNTTDVAGTLKTLAFEQGLIEDRTDATLLSLAGATA